MILYREEKLKIFSKLPSDLQEMIFSDITAGIIDKICKKYNLSEEKSFILVSLISDVLFGIAGLEQLTIILKQQLETDEQTAMNLNIDLTTELFSKVKISLQKINQKIKPSEEPAFSPLKPPFASLPTPAPTSIPAAPTPKTDQYREPVSGGPARQRPEPQAMAGGPEIIDLRKTPPPPIQMPVAAAPAYIPPPKPLTFTKPIERPLIEEAPHRTPSLPPTLRPPVSEVGAPTSPKASVGVEADPHKIPAPAPTLQPMKETLEERPQFIVRPPGLAPTDLPHDVLDLRKDKGEF